MQLSFTQNYFPWWFAEDIALYSKLFGISLPPFNLIQSTRHQALARHSSGDIRLKSMMHSTLSLLIAISTFLPALASLQSTVRSLDSATVLHFTLARRGGSFTANEWPQDYVNLTYLSQELQKTEDRFNLTRRVVKGNRLVRKAKLGGSTSQDEGTLMGKVADDGLWFVYPCQSMALRRRLPVLILVWCRYAKITIGQPPQEIEMDLNMLATDFHVTITTSRKGSRYDDLFSQTGGKLFRSLEP